MVAGGGLGVGERRWGIDGSEKEKERERERETVREEGGRKLVRWVGTYLPR